MSDEAELNSALEARVRAEIEALHHFFVGWFTGVLDEQAFQPGFLDRFDPGFLLIPPAGVVLRLGDLATQIRQAHGSNPKFRIAIRNVRLRRHNDGQVLATYEEWQRNALASIPLDNGRIATVWFDRSEPLRWLHVHETWMPSVQMQAGPFDF